jgi:6-phosphogluconate dehydrogenase
MKAEEAVKGPFQAKYETKEE